METILSHKKKFLGSDEFTVIDKSGDKNIELKFKGKDALVNYLKDNIPLDSSYTVTIDNTLEGNQKILLKHSKEKAKKYQDKHGFNRKAFETKKEIMDTISKSDADPEEQLGKVSTTLQNSGGQVSEGLYLLLAEYVVDVYIKIFGLPGGTDTSNGTGANDRTLRELKNSFNILINAGYTSHTKKDFRYDLISLRNSISKIIMKTQHQTEQLVSKGKKEHAAESTSESKEEEISGENQK